MMINLLHLIKISVTKIYNTNILRKKKVDYGTNLVLYGRLHIHGPEGSIRIGDNCIISSDEKNNPTAGSGYTHLSTAGEGKIIIGNNVGISLARIFAKECITIEDNVLIGAGVKIWDSDFHPLDYNERLAGGEPQVSKITIKEGCFIGAESIILKGVTIGEHSIVGAGSVVTKDVPQYEIWAGNPAKFIRRIEES